MSHHGYFILVPHREQGTRILAEFKNKLVCDDKSLCIERGARRTSARPESSGSVSLPKKLNLSTGTKHFRSTVFWIVRIMFSFNLLLYGRSTRFHSRRFHWRQGHEGAMCCVLLVWRRGRLLVMWLLWHVNALQLCWSQLHSCRGLVMPLVFKENSCC